MPLWPICQLFLWWWTPWPWAGNLRCTWWTLSKWWTCKIRCSRPSFLRTPWCLSPNSLSNLSLRPKEVVSKWCQTNLTDSSLKSLFGQGIRNNFSSSLCLQDSLWVCRPLWLLLPNTRSPPSPLICHNHPHQSISRQNKSKNLAWWAPLNLQSLQECWQNEFLISKSLIKKILWLYFENDDSHQ